MLRICDSALARRVLPPAVLMVSPSVQRGQRTNVNVAVTQLRRRVDVVRTVTQTCGSIDSETIRNSAFTEAESRAEGVQACASAVLTARGR